MAYFKQPPRPWTRKEEEAAACRWRRGGMKLSVIAYKLGRTAVSVSRKLYQRGVIVAPRRRPGELARLVKMLHARGYADCEVADSAGVTQEVASVVRRRLGLPRNLPWKSPRYAGSKKYIGQNCRQKLATGIDPPAAPVRL